MWISLETWLSLLRLNNKNSFLRMDSPGILGLFHFGEKSEFIPSLKINSLLLRTEGNNHAR